MPKFNYIARSADQAEQPGAIEATDAHAARRQLERDGLRVLQLAPEVDWHLASGLPALSASNALDLTAQIAELAKAGLPLAAGLRAMQAELPWGRFSSVVQTLASRLESGAPADSALAAAALRLPSHVRGMLAAGIHSGRLAEVLQECLEHQQMQTDLRRRIWSAIAYPLVVLAITAGWLAFVFGLIVPPMVQIFEDFEVELPSSTQLLLWLSGPGLQILLGICHATVLAVIVLWLCWRTYPVSWLLAKVPLVGPLWRSGNLAVFCRLLAVMLEQSIPLPSALRLTADGLQDAVIKAACLKAADQVEAGQGLSESLAALRVFPHTLTLIVRWGERLSAQSEALRSAAELFRGRTALRADLLTAVFPPIVFVAVGFATLWAVFAMFLPLVKLISSLT
jgi:general secretion pathway protein F